MIIRDFYFSDFSTSNCKVKQIFLNEDALCQRILSFGFYNRNNNNSQNLNKYELNAEIRQRQWDSKWFFGVNYRIKCEHTGVLVQKNIQYANLIANDFVKANWVLIPYYNNGRNDQGVDFTKVFHRCKLSGFYQDEFAKWRNDILAGRGELENYQNSSNQNETELTSIIQEVKELI
jgi:hypothetical protein